MFSQPQNAKIPTQKIWTFEEFLVLLNGDVQQKELLNNGATKISWVTPESVLVEI